MPISCESQYIIDSMTELCHITVDIAESVYHIKMDIDGMVDAGEAGHRVDIEQEVQRQYHQWRPTVDINEQLFISLNGVLGSEDQFAEQVTYTADKIINAFRKTNGISDPMGLEDGTNLYISTEADMLRESNVVFYLEQDRPQTWLRLLEQQFNDFANAYSKTDCVRFLDWEQERKELIIQRMHEQAGEFNERLDIDYVDVEYDRPRRWMDMPSNHKDIKKGQKIIKKGIKTFTNMFGQKDIHAFITGDDFIIHGDRYDYRVSKNRDLVKYSYNPSPCHIPYRLQLLTKESVVLADGCIIFDNTPVIDQLIAMMLHIKNGNEDEIIKTTIFSRLTDAYHNESYIKALKEEQKNERRANDEIRNIDDSPFFMRMEEQTADMQKYRPVLRPIIENVLAEMLNIPKEATRFMIRPPLSYDSIQFLEGHQLEQSLLVIEHNK